MDLRGLGLAVRLGRRGWTGEPPFASAVAPAGFFLRLRPPREPRLVFFLAGWSVGASPSSSATGSASPVSSTSGSSGSALVGLGALLGLGSGAASACFLAGGLRVGFSAALSAVIGSSGAFLPPTSDA